MFEILGNTYDRCIAIELGTVFLVVSENCENLFFDEKFFKILLYLRFIFIHKTGELVLEKLL